MAITAEMIKSLREATGAGVLDCKKALEATGGDSDKAAAYLREKGLAAAAKKASREAHEGLVSVLVDKAGQSGMVVEINCETDFVARTDDFRTFVQAIVKQVAQDTSAADVPALLAQPFIEDRSITVADRLTQIITKVGENMMIRRFARIKRTGDGLVEGYTHPGSRIGVIVYVSAGNPEIAASGAMREFVHDLALQVAAAAPQYVSPEHIPASIVEAERAKYRAQVAEDKKPEQIKDRIVTGKLDKWYEQVCLLRQSFVKDDTMKIGDLIKQKSQQWNTPLVVEQFVRYELERGE